MQILRFIALLSICTCSASALEADTDALRNDEVIEEVVVRTVYRCGSWPIQHQSLISCEYAVLKKENLRAVLDLRRELFEACLICQGNRCVGKEWRDDRVRERSLCKRLFWTPARIIKSVISGQHTSPIRVSFTFKISTKGRIEDVEVVSFEGDIAEAELLQLIRDGAARARFEPVVIADMTYEIVGIRDAFVLGDL
jgi:hypothetical protein